MKPASRDGRRLQTLECPTRRKATDTRPPNGAPLGLLGGPCKRWVRLNSVLARSGLLLSLSPRRRRDGQPAISA